MIASLQIGKLTITFSFGNLAIFNFGNLSTLELPIFCQLLILTTFSSDNFQVWLFSSIIFEYLLHNYLEIRLIVS